MSNPDESLVPNLEVVQWLLASVSIIVVSLRFYTRAVIVRHVAWDDWVMLLSLVIMLVDNVFVQISIHYGLGRHQNTLLDEDAILAIKWDYLAQPPAIIGPAFGRISFAMLLLTLVNRQKGRRILLYALIISQFVVNNLVYILILVQCKPIESLWDHRVKGDCWDLVYQRNIGFFQGCQYLAVETGYLCKLTERKALNGATDLALAAFPAFIVWDLQMKLSQKLSLIALMGLGVFAMVGSILKTVYLPSVGSKDDYTYHTANLIIWWMVEGYLVIIAASIATLRPLIARRKKFTSGSGNSFGVRTFGSSGRKKYPSNGDHTADEYPLTFTGIETTAQPSVEADHDMANSSEAPEGQGGKSIRKTVTVSIDVTGNNRAGT
ncbi:hypothetical protein NUW58_g1279 [Xylaria curta]|uniref:Uncharacterized protein n=1 Tax=Xylaria curta TaxID=42375 RepID=A0ACC1PL43_9PEZI|nr:hypothetical protein NUW58_g1279 [Xylaria curta]